MTPKQKARHPMTRTAVYRFFSASGELLYLGITHNVQERWGTHERIQPWWLDVTRREVTWYDTRAEAERTELAATAVEKPRYDRSGQRTAGGEWDLRLADETKRAQRAISADITSGAFPPWRVLPTYKRLSERYGVPQVGITRAVFNLEHYDQILVHAHDLVAVTCAGCAPTEDAKRVGLIYFLTSNAFGDKPFTLRDLAETTGVTRGTAHLHLRRMEKFLRVERLAKVQGQRSPSYRVIRHPEPDPPKRKTTWSEAEVVQLGEWVCCQLDADETTAGGNLEKLALIARDRRIVAACMPVRHNLPNGFSYSDGSSPWGAPALVELAHPYANRDGYLADWLPSWAYTSKAEPNA